MAGREDMEILVHITAPSEASDDVRYRDLASSYIDFRPHKRLKLTSPVNHHHPSQPSGSISGPVGSQDHLTRQEPQLSTAPQYFLPLSGSPGASFRSVLDNSGSPRVVTKPRTPQHRQAHTQDDETQTSWKTPGRTVQDSVPENNLTTEIYATPTRVLEHYLQHFRSSDEQSIHSSQRSPASVKKTPEQREVSNENQSSSGRNNDGDGLPTIPCTPGNRPLPTSAVELEKTHLAQSRRQGAQYQQQLPTSDDEIIENSILHEEGPPKSGRADSEPPSTRRRTPSRPGPSPSTILRTTSDIGPQKDPEATGRTLTFFSTHGYKFKNLAIRAPEPPVDNASITPDDLITPGLRKLASDLSIPKRFRPETQTRGLRPFERGYWLLDCTDWPAELKLESWAFLANYIGTGTAGWGLSCHRDEEFSWFRVYCWGTIAAHMFLLVYLASRRRVLDTGASWIDGAGDTVIVMGKRA